MEKTEGNKAKANAETLSPAQNEENVEEALKDTTLFECVDKSVQTLFNEPSLGLYYTQQHIQSSFPRLLYYMDNLYDNRKKIRDTVMEVNNTIRDLKELTSLNNEFTFNMLAKIKAIDFTLKNSK